MNYNEAVNNILNENEDLEEKCLTHDKYFFLSEKNMNGETLQPRIPENFLTKNGYEDNKTKRVCFSTSIDGALKALSQNLKGKTFYVHTPSTNISVKTPSISEVPDSKITNEVWCLDPVKLSMIGKIHVIKDDGNPGYRYKYGNKTAELYGWDWEWTTNINESYDPPYNAEQIRQNYGEDTYKRLIKDPAHKHRMDTGIELIHKEPTDTELERIWKNWQLMSDKDKKESDRKSVELFGMTNAEHYKKLTESDTKLTLYHLSKTPITKLTPRIPKSDFEDQKTPRICFSTSIQGCLIGINENKNILGETFKVYKLETSDYYKPNKKEVADVDITDEIWVLKECEPEFLYDIKVTSKKSSKKAEIAGNSFIIPMWEYEKVKPLIESEILDESLLSKQSMKIFEPINKELTYVQVFPLGKDLKDLEMKGNAFTSRKYITPEGYLKVGFYNGESVDKEREKDCIKTINLTPPENIVVTADWHINTSDVDVFIKKLSAYTDESTVLLVLGDVTYTDATLTSEVYPKICDAPIATRKKYWIDCKKILSHVPHKKAYLVLGNHDEKFMSDFYKDGFDFVTNRLETDKYVFTHIPEKTNKINIHGHNHGNGRTVGFSANKHFDVGYAHLKRRTEGLDRGFYRLSDIRPGSDYKKVYGEKKFFIIADPSIRYIDQLPCFFSEKDEKIYLTPRPGIKNNEKIKEGLYTKKEIFKLVRDFYSKDKLREAKISIEDFTSMFLTESENLNEGLKNALTALVGKIAYKITKLKNNVEILNAGRITLEKIYLDDISFLKWVEERALSHAKEYSNSNDDTNAKIFTTLAEKVNNIKTTLENDFRSAKIIDTKKAVLIKVQKKIDILSDWIDGKTKELDCDKLNESIQQKSILDKARDIMEKMNDIEYGTVYANGKVTKRDNDDWYDDSNKFCPQPVLSILKTKTGHCIDQSELERYYFKKAGIKHKVFSMFPERGTDMYHNHTFLVFFDENDTPYWFDHAWYSERGIHKGESLEELFKRICDKKRKADPKNDPENAEKFKYIKYEIFEVPAKACLSWDGYVDWVWKQKLIYKG